MDESDEDDESPWEHMARVAADIEAGRAEVPPRWKLDRPSPGVLVWTTPSGCRYASTLTGEWLPVPKAGPRAWLFLLTGTQLVRIMRSGFVLRT